MIGERVKDVNETINMSHTIQSCQFRINVLQYISPCFSCRLLWWHLILRPFLEKKEKESIDETQPKKTFFFLKIASIRNECFLLIFSTIILHPLPLFHIIRWLLPLNLISLCYLLIDVPSFNKVNTHTSVLAKSKTLEHLQHMFQHQFDSFSTDIAICVVDIGKQIEFGKWGFPSQPIATNSNRIIIYENWIKFSECYLLILPKCSTEQRNQLI